MRRFKVGLALGGGGTRGFAHIGVLKVLEREGINIDVIAGTSMGAIIGGLYAIQPKAELLQKRTESVIRGSNFKRLRIDIFKRGDEERDRFFLKRFIKYAKDFYQYNLLRREIGLIRKDILIDIINQAFPDVDVSACKIPFAAISADIAKGEEKILNSGPIRKAVLASIALSGVIPPVQYKGSFLADGGVLSITPVKEAYQLGADMVIAVDVKGRLKHLDVNGIKSGLEAIARTQYITSIKLNSLLLQMADIVITPQVKDIRIGDFGKYKKCVREGEEATNIKLKDIHNLLKRKKVSTFLKRMWKS